MTSMSSNGLSTGDCGALTVSSSSPSAGASSGIVVSLSDRAVSLCAGVSTFGTFLRGPERGVERGVVERGVITEDVLRRLARPMATTARARELTERGQRVSGRVTTRESVGLPRSTESHR